MSIESFDEQILEYKKGDHSEFRRIKLIYSFQDLVHTLSSYEDISPLIIESIESLTQLHLIDPSLFPEISSDLLEPTIRLQILSAPKFPKALTQLSITLATYSKAIEFQKELSNIMKLLSSNESFHPFEVFRDAQGPYSKDIFKTVITFYIPIILRMLEDSEIREGIAKMMDFVEFIKIDIQDFHVSLGSELIPEIFQVIYERKAVLIKSAYKETLVFLLELLSVYGELKIFGANKKELIITISKIFGDFSRIREKFVEFKLNLYFPLCILSIKSAKGKIEELALPYFFSGKLRLLNFAPAGVFCNNGNFRNKILSLATFYCDCEIKLLNFNFCYKNCGNNEIFSVLLKNIFKYPGSSLKESKSLAEKLFFKVFTNDRIKIVKFLVDKNDTKRKLNFLIGLLPVTEEIEHNFISIVDKLLSLRPVISYLALFHSLSRFLLKINVKTSVSGLSFFDKIKDLYNEILCNLDPDIPKVSLILENLRFII